MLFVIFVILLLVAITALYVAAEFASVAVKVIRIQALAESGNKTAQRLLPHLADAHSLDRYVAACQIGITASSLVLGAFGQKRLAEYIGPTLVDTFGLTAESAASVTATSVLILLTTFHVVLGELLPKALALRFPERIAIALTYPMIVSLWLFKWFIKVLNGSGNLILRLMRVPAAGHRHVHSPEELQQLVSHGEGGVELEETERRLMSQVFRFGEHKARNVMVPRTRVNSLDLQRTLEENLKTMESSGHTRFPVFNEEADNVVGYVHIKDVTRAVADGALVDLTTLMRPPVFAPVSISVDKLFDRMRKERSHMVILLDEFGGTAGIVTMEDILQEVVGEMQDEFGRKTQRILIRDGNSMVVRGNLLLDQLERESGWELGEHPAETVGGLIMHLLARPAKPGDCAQAGAAKLTVLDVSGNRITRVRVERD